jgi:hypothetical protein
MLYISPEVSKFQHYLACEGLHWHNLRNNELTLRKHENSYCEMHSSVLLCKKISGVTIFEKSRISLKKI